MFKINITNEGQRASWAIHVVRTKHDLCGIVVKNALAESSQKKKHQANQIRIIQFKKCERIIFFKMSKF